MAHIPLEPIGRPRKESTDDRTFDAIRAAVAKLEEELAAKRTEVEAGWGPKYVERVHAKGKLTTRERIAKLIDPGTDIFEVGRFVNDGDTFQGGLKSPAAGVVTAFARVEGRWCMIIGNDNTVASGSGGRARPKNPARADHGAPAPGANDLPGRLQWALLPEQSRSFLAPRARATSSR
ncbi:MAG: carboxyl transferase domain-containing protein [Polyangiales bacterium]